MVVQWLDDDDDVVEGCYFKKNSGFLWMLMKVVLKMMKK